MALAMLTVEGAATTTQTAATATSPFKVVTRMGLERAVLHPATA